MQHAVCMFIIATIELLFYGADYANTQHPLDFA